MSLILCQYCLLTTTGETSMSPLSPMSPGEASCGESVPARASLDSDLLVGDHSDTPDAGERPRLQRAHGPSKKTFKFRRSRHTKPDVRSYFFNFRLSGYFYLKSLTYSHKHYLIRWKIARLIRCVRNFQGFCNSLTFKTSF